MLLSCYSYTVSKKSGAGGGATSGSAMAARRHLSINPLRARRPALAALTLAAALAAARAAARAAHALARPRRRLSLPP